MPKIRDSITGCYIVNPIHFYPINSDQEHVKKSSSFQPTLVILKKYTFSFRLSKLILSVEIVIQFCLFRLCVRLV